jgi:hypothetical protein
MSYLNFKSNYPKAGEKSVIFLEIFCPKSSLITTAMVKTTYNSQVSTNYTIDMYLIVEQAEHIKLVHEFGNCTGVYLVNFELISISPIACWRFSYNVE